MYQYNNEWVSQATDLEKHKAEQKGGKSAVYGIIAHGLTRYGIYFLFARDEIGMENDHFNIFNVFRCTTFC